MAQTQTLAAWHEGLSPAVASSRRSAWQNALLLAAMCTTECLHITERCAQWQSGAVPQRLFCLLQTDLWLQAFDT